MDPSKLGRKAGVNGPLTPRQRKIAEFVGQGMSWRAAAQHVGMRNNETAWKSDPRMHEVIREEQAKYAKQAELKREDIIQGLKDAVDLAKMMSDPHALIKAWAELGRLCGFYAPEVKKLDISVTSKRVISQLEQLSERELLELANEELGATFEGHFRRLPVRPVPILSHKSDIVDAEIVSEGLNEPKHT
jgi:hypothetical protein